MTNEEAIKYGKEKLGLDEDLIKIAIEAFEKQRIPKKPKEKHKLGDTDPYVYGYCASCGEPINYEFQYCPACGQKADWSDKE